MEELDHSLLEYDFVEPDSIDDDKDGNKRRKYLPRCQDAMRITMGVTGGVAAYKAAELVRLLQQDGFSVEVVMTRGAREFITPLTFAALTGQKVITELFGNSE